MGRSKGIIILCTAAALFLCSCESGKNERAFVRKGNKEYRKGNFEEANTEYQRALAIDSTMYEARFNSANVHYKLENYEEAQKRYETLLKTKDLSGKEIAEINFNLGNSRFKQENYEGAIEAYKESLRRVPEDYEAKFNLVFAMMMQQQQDNQDQNQNKEQDKEQEQDQNQDQGGDGDQKDDKQQQPPQDSDGDNDQQNEAREQPQGGMNRQDAEQILNAMQGMEDHTQDKVKEGEAVKVGVGKRKNW